ncbi:MAG: SHOCT domain-containing protein [Cellulomonas sp.]
MPRRRGRPGLMGTMARTAVVAGTATAVSGGMHRNQAEQASQQQQLAQAQAQQDAAQQQAAIDDAVARSQAQQAAAAPPAPAAPAEDRMAKIRELGQLKADGLLTEEEFAAEKAKILAS